MEILIKKIKENNGTAMLIGGGVIDYILNIPIKDWDIEVYGITYEKLTKILHELKLPANLVGKSFGVIKTKINDIDIDLSIPRLENKCGIGHQGFDVILDSNLTVIEAGRRRDLTINSMYKNLHTDELVDPFNGLEDLNNGVLRATNNETFIEDPLRIFRIMQLLPRKGKVVAKETIKLCKSMISTFNELPKERIFEEFNKLLLKSSKPSMGLNFLKECGWLIHFPELNNLIGCKQNPDWHPEGDVWVHTLMVIDNAASLRDELPEELRLSFMYGALLHDVGKPSTTLEDLTSNGHDSAGVPIAETFMLRITNDVKLIELVKNLVKLHMRVGQLTTGKAGIPAWKRLHNEMRLDILGLLSKSDSCGRTGRNLNDEHEPSKLSFSYYDRFGTKKIEPIVKGIDLIELGWNPGAELGKMLKLCYEAQLDGYTTKKEIFSRLKIKKRNLEKKSIKSYIFMLHHKLLKIWKTRKNLNLF